MQLLQDQIEAPTKPDFPFIVEQTTSGIKTTDLLETPAAYETDMQQYFTSGSTKAQWLSVRVLELYREDIHPKEILRKLVVNTDLLDSWNDTSRQQALLQNMMSGSLSKEPQAITETYLKKIIHGFEHFPKEAKERVLLAANKAKPNDKNTDYNILARLGLKEVLGMAFEF